MLEEKIFKVPNPDLKSNLLKCALILIFSIVAALLTFIMSEEKIPKLIYMSAVVTIGSFSYLTFHYTRKLFNDSQGITVNSQGLILHIGLDSMGLIPWEKITYFEKTKSWGDIFIDVYVTNPEYFIERTFESYKLKDALGADMYRKEAYSNIERGCALLSIPLKYLSVNDYELFETLQKYHQKSQI